MTDTARRPAAADRDPIPLPDLVLYSRDGCHLCDEAREIVGALLRHRTRRGLANPPFVERDIASDPALEHRFGATIPVLELGDERLELATSVARIRRLLAKADTAG